MLKKGICVALMIVMIFPMIYSQEITKENKTLFSKDTQNTNNQNFKVDCNSEVDRALKESQSDANKNESALKWGAISSLTSCLIGGGGAFLITLALYPLFSVSLLDGMGAMCLLTTVGSTLLPSNPTTDYKFINSSDVYKEVYSENYKKATTLNKIKYSFIGGTVSYILTFGFLLMFAITLIGLYL